MKKTYEPETKSAIEQVIDVFNDYIRTLKCTPCQGQF